jgi:hypothetical protein
LQHERHDGNTRVTRIQLRRLELELNACTEIATTQLTTADHEVDTNNTMDAERAQRLKPDESVATMEDTARNQPDSGLQEEQGKPAPTKTMGWLAYFNLGKTDSGEGCPARIQDLMRVDSILNPNSRVT